MTLNRDFIHLPRVNPTLLLKGLGWLGSVSLLTSGMGLAQTAPSSEGNSVPSAVDLLGTDAPAPAAEPSALAPAPSAPAVSAPEPSRPAEPLTVHDLDATPQAAGNFDSPYIDTTDYSVGATDSPTIIFSERSTGCQRVARGSDMPSGCPSSLAYRSGGSDDTVSLGPVSVGSDGIHINSPAVRQSVQNFLNLTPRPSALPNNGNTRLMFPLSIAAPITSLFGWRVHPIFGSTRFHAGTDLGAPMGTPVLAAYSGRVITADFMGGYGLTVLLQHDNGQLQTLYGHMSELFVHAGDRVEQGEVIGRVGSTGNSTGPHLHFEVRQRNGNSWVAVNPGGLLQQATANFGQVPQVVAIAQPELVASQKDLSKASEAAGTAASILDQDDLAQLSKTKPTLVNTSN